MLCPRNVMTQLPILNLSKKKLDTELNRGMSTVDPINGPGAWPGTNTIRPDTASIECKNFLNTPIILASNESDGVAKNVRSLV